VSEEEFFVDPLTAIRHLDEMFARAEIEYWVFGGWAVDFHAGRVTRDHADIDIAIWQADAEAVARLLVDRGWTPTPAPEHDGYTSYTRDGVDLDLAFLARDGQGTVYTPLRSGRGEWPADSFGSDVGDLSGSSAHLVSAISLVEDKSQARDDVATARKDAADLAVLRSVIERSGERRRSSSSPGNAPTQRRG
jgi:Aminoglycoside-2''-adenylyltransferase